MTNRVEPKPVVAQHRPGVALMLVLIVLAVVGVMGLSYLAAQGPAATIAANLAHENRARYIADSALQLAINEVLNNAQWRTAYPSGQWASGTMDGGTFVLRGEDGIYSSTTGVLTGDGSLSDDAQDPVSLTATATCQGVTHVSRVLITCGGGASPGLTAKYFASATGLTQLSNVQWNSTPTYTRTVGNINVANVSDTTPMWPGGPSNDYGVWYNGHITIPQSGSWTFWTQSDDGSDLTIDGIRVVNNDGLHAMASASGTVTLTAGRHTFQARMFEHTGYHGMIASWRGPGVSSKTVIPASAFTHDGSSGAVVAPGVTLSGGVTMSNSAIIDAFNSSLGPYSNATKVASGVLASNTTASSSIILSNSAALTGSVRIGVGGNVNWVVPTSSQSQISGGVSAMTTALSIPAASMPSGMPVSSGSQSISSNTTISGNRRYTNLSLSNSAVVTISGNVRIQCDGTFNMSNSAQIVIPSGSSLALYAAHGISISNTSQCNIASGDPTRCVLTVTGTGKTVQLSNTAQVYAQVFNPGGGLTLSNSAQLCGSFEGKSIAMSNTSAIHMDINGLSSDDSGGTPTYTVFWVDQP